MTEREIALEEAAHRVLIAMFGGPDLVGSEVMQGRIIGKHQNDNTIEWQQAKRYAKAALGYAST